MSGSKIGYAGGSTVGQDLTAQRNALVALPAAPEQICVDYGPDTVRARSAPGLAFAARRSGDTTVVARGTPGPGGAR